VLVRARKCFVEGGLFRGPFFFLLVLPLELLGIIPQSISTLSISSILYLLVVFFTTR
jgi:hypothetical protein